MSQNNSNEKAAMLAKIEISGRTHCGTGEFCKGLLCGNSPRVSKL